jgi:hypothetical protein
MLTGGGREAEVAERFSGMPASSGSKASCRSGRTRPIALGVRPTKFKNLAAPAVKREAEEDWEMAINYRTHFAYRIDLWDADGENVIEHLAGVEDAQVAMATYVAACQRWPRAPITLRQGSRVIEDSRRTRLV